MFLLELVCASSFFSLKKIGQEKIDTNRERKENVSKLAKGYKKKQKICCLSTPGFLS